MLVNQLRSQSHYFVFSTQAYIPYHYGLKKKDIYIYIWVWRPQWSGIYACVLKTK